MSKYRATGSGILIPERLRPTVTLLPCGYCPKQILVEQEPHGRPIIRNGKPMCRKCAILNGRMGKMIRGRQREAEADVEAANEHKREQERQRLFGLSAVSNSKTLKNLAE